jgi:ribose 5-phosphate isomerase A
MLTRDEMKQIAGEYAVQFVQPGMTIGIGTGSTVYYFIRAMAKKIAEGFPLSAVPTSAQTAALAQQWQIPLIDPNGVTSIDITIDGADEISTDLQLIKGGGGALLQEKIVAAASRQLIIIADAEKIVQTLGKFPLPVETIPFAWTHTQRHISDHFSCSKVILRKKGDTVFISDHGNYILDCYFERIENAAALCSALNNIPGVVENGLFINMAAMAIIGRPDGTVERLAKN